MCLFIESIQLNNGVFKRLPLHQARVEAAISDFYPESKAFDLVEFLNKSSFPTSGLYKCRVVFDSEVKLIEFVPYMRRNINSLKLVETEIVSLHYKMENRADFNAAFGQRDNCDDVLLVKKGLLTDTSYCNIALFDGNEWVTPRVPLLYGVCRSELLTHNKIVEGSIRVSDLVNYQRIRLFNAMIEFGDVELDISAIQH
jgi:4-amino-4-deoxychorismate lyase